MTTLILAAALLAPVESTPAKAQPTTVALLPWTAQPAQHRWLGDGLTQSWTHRLLRKANINTISPAQTRDGADLVRCAPNKATDATCLKRWAQVLGADVVFTGTIIKSGKSVEATLIAFRSTDGELSKETLKTNSIWQLETSMIESIAVVLGDPEPEVLPTAIGTDSVRAWSLTTRGWRRLRDQPWAPRWADPLRQSVVSKKEIAAAEQDFRAALAQDPSFGHAYLGIAAVLALKNDPDAAWRALGQATRLGAGEHPESTVVSAFTKTRQGANEEALEILGHAVSRHPGFLFARELLGLSQNHLGRHREAAATFDAYVQRAPQRPQAWIGRGYSRSRRRAFKAALKDTMRAVELAPEVSEFRVELASRYIDSGDHKAARNELEKALATDPDNDLAHIRLGYIRLHENDLEGCVRHSRAGLKAARMRTGSRDRGYAQLNLAQCLGAQGDLDSAFQHVTRARDLGIVRFDSLLEDPRLKALRDDERFGALVPR